MHLVFNMPDICLTLSNVHKSFGLRTVLNNLSIGLYSSQKVGLIGDNGAGKSTLLKILANLEPYDEGQRSMRKDLRIAYLHQNPTYPLDETVSGILSKALQHSHEAWDIAHRVEHMAEDIGIPHIHTPVSTLSGGTLKKTAIAECLLQNPDVLFLDEPTNHLDATTIAWLENRIVQTQAACVVITHDRYFLQRAVQNMWELRKGTLRHYEGSYNHYLEQRAQEEMLEERFKHRRLQVLKAELAWAGRSPPARTTKAKARLERIEMAQEEQQRLQEKNRVASMVFQQAPRLGKTVLEMKDVCFGYTPEKLLLNHFSCLLKPGERIGVIGNNGSGKTSFLKLLQGMLKPHTGKVVQGPNTRIAYFDQHRSTLNLNHTLVQNLTPEGGDHVYPSGDINKKTHVSSWLQRFAFPSESHGMLAEKLSGGERNRLALAQFFLQNANVLMLDEPTNDLDLLTLHILEEALLGFEGCVVSVSHDRYFLDKIATALVAFEALSNNAHTVTLIQGDYTTYERLRLPELEEMFALAQKKQEEPVALKPAAPSSAPKKLSYAERLELENIEDVIQRAEERKTQLEASLEDPSVWSGSPEESASIQKEWSEATQKLDHLYTRWQYLLDKQFNLA
jgi:ATP-binding cassette subfamily F protein uup